MRNFIPLLVTIAVMAGCEDVPENPSGNQSAHTVPRPESAELGALLNIERRKHGLPALLRSRTLDAVAMKHAEDMAGGGYFSHTGRGGSTPQGRLLAAGYRSCLTAENIAAGQQSASDVMRDWMQSQGHRQNNLRQGVTEYGTAVAGHGYWVLVVARPGC